jgi:hypothetical protein
MSTNSRNCKRTAKDEDNSRCRESSPLFVAGLRSRQGVSENLYTGDTRDSYRVEGRENRGLPGYPLEGEFY